MQIFITKHLEELTRIEELWKTVSMFTINKVSFFGYINKLELDYIDDKPACTINFIFNNALKKYCIAKNRISKVEGMIYLYDAKIPLEIEIYKGNK